MGFRGRINHVITRGLNRQDIFLDDCDRNDFLGRLEKNLYLTGLQVLLIHTSNRSPLGSDAESVCVLASLTDRGWSETKRRRSGRCFGRNWPGISVYPGLQSQRPSSDVKNFHSGFLQTPPRDDALAFG